MQAKRDLGNRQKNGPAPKGNKHAIGNRGPAPHKYNHVWLANEAELIVKWFDKPRNIWLKGFALERGYHPDLFEDFARRSEVFAKALKIAKQKQEHKLIDKGLFNETNAAITKFVLINNHGWTESALQPPGASATPITITINKITK